MAVRCVPDRFVGITRLVAMSTEVKGRHRPIEANGRAAVQGASPMFTVHIARVRADVETGDFRLTGYAAVQDVGRAINPPEIEAQIHGGVAQALGRPLWEQVAYDTEGNPQPLASSTTRFQYISPPPDQVRAGLAAARESAGKVDCGLLIGVTIDENRGRTRELDADIAARSYGRDFRPFVDRYLIAGDAAECAERIVCYREA